MTLKTVSESAKEKATHLEIAGAGTDKADKADQTTKLYYQTRTMGLVLQEQDLEARTKAMASNMENASSQETTEQYRYLEAKGIISQAHEFLKPKHGLYRDTLACLMPQITESQDAETTTSQREFITKTENRYEALISRYSSNMAGYLESYDSVHEKNEKTLKAKGKDRAELYILMIRDVTLLHSLELKNIASDISADATTHASTNTKTHTNTNDNLPKLTKEHREKIAEEVYTTIQSYSKPYSKRAQSDMLNTEDKIVIAEVLHERTASADFWRELARSQIRVTEREPSVEPVRREAESELMAAGKPIMEAQEVLVYYKNEIEDITKLKPCFDIEALKKQLSQLNTKTGQEYIEAIRYESFRQHVIPELNKINEAVEEAKTPDALLKSMEHEKEFCTSVYDEHLRLTMRFEEHEHNDQISRISTLYDDDPHLLESLTHNVTTLSSSGIMTEQEIMGILTQEKERNYENYENMEHVTFEACQNHFVREVTRDLDYMHKHGKVEINNATFKEEITYLEHRMSDPNTARYLHDSHIEDMFHEIRQEHGYENEERNEEHECEHTRSRGYGIDM